MDKECFIKPWCYRCFAIFCIAYVLQGCSEDSNKREFNQLERQHVMLDLMDRNYGSPEPLRPLPTAEDLQYTAELVSLGRSLYHDKRLSGNRQLNCASCHRIDRGGHDAMQFSVGINNSVGKINAPTVLNSAFNFVQFWDGRAKNLQEQAASPVENPIEMGENWDNVVATLTNDADYEQSFVDAFGDKTITRERITLAIAEFESVLITPSPFDRFLRGDLSAISTNAAKGYQLFKDHGCSSCHQGINVGGNLYQKFGAIESYYSIKNDADKGRMMVTNNSRDLSVFKVPSLRNVAITSPYFHTGAVNELETAIRIMGMAQLGKILKEEDVGLISDFLRSLTGDKNLQDDIAVAGENN